jgi:hypothetical protein
MVGTHQVVEQALRDIQHCVHFHSKLPFHQEVLHPTLVPFSASPTTRLKPVIINSNSFKLDLTFLLWLFDPNC